MKQPVRDASTEFRPAACSAPGWDSLENRRTALAILLLIIAGGLVLRTYGLYGRSMWFDESVSWRTIQFPFAEMIDRTARDIHAPLFYVLLRLWDTLFGESIVSLRTFSLAFSALAMLGVYLFTVEAMAMGRSPGDGGAGALLRSMDRPGSDRALRREPLSGPLRLGNPHVQPGDRAGHVFQLAAAAGPHRAAATRFALAALYARGAWLCLHALQCADSRSSRRRYLHWAIFCMACDATSWRRSRTSVSAGSPWHTRAWRRAGPPGSRCSWSKGGAWPEVGIIMFHSPSRTYPPCATRCSFIRRRTGRRRLTH